MRVMLKGKLALEGLESPQESLECLLKIKRVFLYVNGKPGEVIARME